LVEKVILVHSATSVCEIRVVFLCCKHFTVFEKFYFMEYVLSHNRSTYAMDILHSMEKCSYVNEQFIEICELISHFFLVIFSAMFDFL